MKKILCRVFAVIFGLLGLGISVFGVYTALHSRNVPPVLLEQPEAAVQSARALLDSLCAGDYAGAGAYFVGTPSLGQLSEDATEAEKLIWSAFTDSLEYTTTGECYASDSGVAMDVQLTGLEISSVTANLKGRSQSLLSRRVEEAEDVSEIYDESNNYREDFVMEVLKDAAADAIREDGKLRQADVTLHLVYQQGRWLVIPEQSLLTVLSGWTA